MLPKNWADPNAAPKIWELPGERRKLARRYDNLGPSQPLDRVFAIAQENAATHAVLEWEYIDADYRDEFAHFYAGTFPPFPDRCERVHFHDDRAGRYLGYTVLRPIVKRPVCRTLIAPPDGLVDDIRCLCPSVAQPYGMYYQTRGFPFIGQDYQYGVCAHASIWMIALYHHLRFNRPRFYLSDLVTAAGAEHEADRLIPSAGLTAQQMAAIFRAIQMPAVHYDYRAMPANCSAESIIRRYLDSELPVLVATRRDGIGHASVYIGHGRDEDGAYFIKNDDLLGPYVKCRLPEGEGDTPGGGEQWRALMVPTPGRIYLSGEAAEEEAATQIMATLRSEPSAKSVLSGLRDGQLGFRTYAVQAGDYKRVLDERAIPERVVSCIRRAGTSHWIWITELGPVDGSSDETIGEIAIDATSDRLSPRPLFLALPGTVHTWPSLGKRPSKHPEGAELRAPYASGVRLRPGKPRTGLGF